MMEPWRRGIVLGSVVRHRLCGKHRRFRVIAIDTGEWLVVRELREIDGDRLTFDAANCVRADDPRPPWWLQ